MTKHFKQTLLVLLTFMICAMAFSCKEEKVSPGTYLFDESGHDKFVTIDLDYEKEINSNSSQSSVKFKVNVTPKKYNYIEAVGACEAFWTCSSCRDEKILNSFYFENCYIDVEFKVNGETSVERYNLDETGSFSKTHYIEISPTYKTKNSCKVVGFGGSVYAEPYGGATFDYKGVRYEYYGECVRVDEILDKTSVLTLYDYVYNDDGRKFRVSYESLPYATQNCVGCSETHNEAVKTVEFLGDFYYEDFVGAPYENWLGWGRNYCWDEIKKIFPNVNVIAIENISIEEAYDQNFTFNVPEKGVTFYVNDNTGGIFTQDLYNSNFITVRSFSEYNSVDSASSGCSCGAGVWIVAVIAVAAAVVIFIKYKKK